MCKKYFHTDRIIKIPDVHLNCDQLFVIEKSQPNINDVKVA